MLVQKQIYKLKAAAKATAYYKLYRRKYIYVKGSLAVKEG
jgi:hypothetical protein